MKKNNLLNLGLSLFVGLSLVQGVWAEDADMEKDEGASEEARTGIYYEYGEGLRARTAGEEIDLTLNLYNKFKFDVIDTDTELWGRGNGGKVHIPQSRVVLDSDFLGGIVNFYGEMDLVGINYEYRNEYRNKAFIAQEVSLNITPVENVTFKIGQWYTPFNNESYDYDEFKLNMESASLTGEYFGYFPELGIGVETSFNDYEFVFGVFNGDNISDRKTEIKTDYKIAAMLSKTIFGEYDRSVSSDINYSKKAALNVGIYAVYDKGKEKDTGDRYSDRRIGGDIGYKHLGLSTEAGLFFSDVDVKGGQNFSTLGANAKASYFLVPKQFEGVVRLSWLNFRHDADDARNALEPAVGLNYYILGENLRVGTMLSYVSTSYRSDKTTDDLRWLTTLVALF